MNVSDSTMIESSPQNKLVSGEEGAPEITLLIFVRSQGRELWKALLSLGVSRSSGAANQELV